MQKAPQASVHSDRTSKLSDREFADRVVRAALGAPYINEGADDFARRIGLRNRHQLNRRLHEAGLPAWHNISAFVRVLAIHDDAQCAHRSACAQAIATGMAPAWFYRAFKRVTGRSWSACRQMTHDELVDMFRQSSHRACRTE